MPNFNEFIKNADSDAMVWFGDELKKQTRQFEDGGKCWGVVIESHKFTDSEIQMIVRQPMGMGVAVWVVFIRNGRIMPVGGIDLFDRMGQDNKGWGVLKHIPQNGMPYKVDFDQCPNKVIYDIAFSLYTQAGVVSMYCKRAKSVKKKTTSFFCEKILKNFNRRVDLP